MNNFRTLLKDNSIYIASFCVIFIFIMYLHMPITPTSKITTMNAVAWAKFREIGIMLQEYYQNNQRYPNSLLELNATGNAFLDPFTGKQFLYFVASKESFNDSCIIASPGQGSLDIQQLRQFTGDNIGKIPSQWTPPFEGRIYNADDPESSRDGILYLQLIRNCLCMNEMKFHLAGFADIGTKK